MVGSMRKMKKKLAELRKKICINESISDFEVS